MDFLRFCEVPVVIRNLSRSTCHIVRELEGWDSVLDVHIENIVVFFTLVELLATLTDSVHNVADLLPRVACSIPLVYSSIQS